MKPSLSVLVASSGRSTLARTLQSIAPQLCPGDECLIDVNDDAPWGHAARNRLMPRAQGDALLFQDDDDCYLPDSFDVIRARFAECPDRLHVFRMAYGNGRVLWDEPVLRLGNCSTQMLVVPNMIGRLGQFGDRYEGDFDFAESTCRLLGAAVFHEDVIALVRPHEIAS